MASLARDTAIFSAVAFVFLFGLLISISSEDFPRITGMPVASLIVVELSHKVCNISLSSGWNLVSIPCLEDSVPVPFALLSLYTNQSPNSTNCSVGFSSVHAYAPLDSEDHWKSYNPCLPSYVVQDLLNMNDKQGYFIRMKHGSRLEYVADVTIPNYVQLYQGYNLVGYPTNLTAMNRSVDISIQTINSTYSALFKYSLGSWLIYNASLQQFSQLEPYHGYWFRMDDNSTWVVDW
jgi:hypothetical protein